MTADVPDPNTPPSYPAPLSGGYPTQPPVFPVETAADRVPYQNPAAQNQAAQNPPIGLPGSISYVHPLRPPPTPPPPTAPRQSAPLQSASQPVVRTVGAALQKMAARGQLATMSLIAFVVFGGVFGGWWWAWLFFLLPALVEANRRRR